MAHSRRDAVMDERYVSAELGVIIFLHPGARLMEYASMIYNTLISLESEAQLILESCSLHLTTLEPSLCTWPA